MKRAALMAAALLAASPAFAADPVRIGVTTILSGSDALRGQSEQYGIELALQRINESGGVLGRPVEAFYGDNASDPQTGIRAVHRLIDEQHVSVVIGALLTAVTHAIMPVMQDAKVPLIIEISSLQDFVEASGVGGNPYVFKTIPSELDIARGMMGWLKKQGAKRIAIVADDAYFDDANSQSFSRAASEAGIAVTTSITIARGTTDLDPVLDQLKAIGPDHIVPILHASAAPFFAAYEKSGLTVPLTGRIDFPAAAKAVSPGFLAAGGLDKAASVSLFSAAIEAPGVQDFVKAYEAKYGLVPNQLPFYAYEATNLVVDAIRRAGSDKPADIEAALKTTRMPSLLGGTYALDDHNHAHMPLQILGWRNGKVAVLDPAA
jgi:branched-chain amino acid transport system substrate-binding protein